MTNLPESTPSGRYSDGETDAILRRAAELSADAGSSPAPRGLTLPEMEALAREAGLDPALIRRAAQEVGLRGGARSSPWLGAPTRMILERTLPGPVTEAQWEVIVGEVQRSLGRVGHISRAGHSRFWATMETAQRHGGRDVSLSITSHGGTTVIRAEESFNRMVGSLFGGLVGGMGGGGVGLWMGVGMGVFHSPAAAIGLVALNLTGSYLLARAIYRRTIARRTGELDALLARAVDAARAAGD